MSVTFRPLLEIWPNPTPEWRRRSRSTFSAPWHNTLSLLDRELAHLKAKHIVIQADFAESDIRLDGYPRSNARQPNFPGVRVAFDSKHGPLVYQTDICSYWQHNVRSIALGLEALRAVDRYGVSMRGEQYTGWKAIGSGPTTRTPQYFSTTDEALRWLRSEECLGFYGGGGMSIKSLLRQAAMSCHPDRGGSREKWDRFEEAKRLVQDQDVA